MSSKFNVTFNGSVGTVQMQDSVEVNVVMGQKCEEVIQLWQKALWRLQDFAFSDEGEADADAIYDYIKKIEAQIPTWIAIDESLPEKNHFVLVLRRWRNTTVGKCVEVLTAKLVNKSPQ